MTGMGCCLVTHDLLAVIPKFNLKNIIHLNVS